jgi:hypothetical protein
MATEIAMNRPDPERLQQIEQWLSANVGSGSYRTVKNTWLGMDDWFYYDNVADPVVTEGEEIDDPEDLDEGDYKDPQLVFTFRRGEDATVFALQWL